MKISSRVTPEGVAGHMWPAGHGFSTTALKRRHNDVTGAINVPQKMRCCLWDRIVPLLTL